MYYYGIYYGDNSDKLIYWYILCSMYYIYFSYYMHYMYYIIFQSGNLEISKQQIAVLKKEISELRQSVEHTENVLEDKVACVEENLGHIENRVQEMYDYQLNLSFIEDKLIDLEERSRRNNLRVDGIK